MKFLFCFILFSCTVVKTYAQDIILDAKIIKAKQTEKDRLLKVINETLQKPIADSTYLQYETTFWGMMYLEQKPKAALPKIKTSLQNFTTYDNDFQNALLEVVYSQYPKELEKEIADLIKDTSITTKQFAVCGEYLKKTNKKYESSFQFLYNKRKSNIVEDSKDYIYLKTLLHKNNLDNKFVKEIFQDLMSNTFFPKKNILISLQNKNRNFPGLVIIRDSTGKLLIQNDTIFYTQQLTRSITNLPFYISNGNTPQGIFRINGFGISKNNSIGPTENFQLCMPFECDVKDFFDENILDTFWNNSLYDNKLLLEKYRFKEYKFLQEAAIAGKLGRYEIISHGSTVNPIYYKTKPYTGFTPTMGCLQAKEIWDYNTGKRLYSDQQKLVDAYKSIGAEKGYLIVLDIIDANRPVNINDLKNLLK